MRAIVFDRYGEPEVMHLRDVPVPEPQDGEVLIRVGYAGVNPSDSKARSGQSARAGYRLRGVNFPFVTGMDAAGVVEQTGLNVNRFRQGDRVITWSAADGKTWVSYAEFMRVSARSVSPMPKSLNFAQAAAVPVASLTAFQALFHSEKGGMIPGRPVGRPRRVFDREQVWKLRAQGLSLRSIAKYLDIGVGTIVRALAKREQAGIIAVSGTDVAAGGSVPKSRQDDLAAAADRIVGRASLCHPCRRKHQKNGLGVIRQVGRADSDCSNFLQRRTASQILLPLVSLAVCIAEGPNASGALLHRENQPVVGERQRLHLQIVRQHQRGTLE